MQHCTDHCSIVYNNQDMETTQVYINRWVDKKVVVSIYNRILLCHKKNEILPVVTAWIHLEGIMVSEISQTEKDKFHMISLIWGI